MLGFPHELLTVVPGPFKSRTIKLVTIWSQLEESRSFDLLELLDLDDIELKQLLAIVVDLVRG